jgi:mannose-1-phosphate guanylyltransferase/mannose-6-phosphate isomerase
MIVPIILAGGSGTRLWPLSREEYPKQLLPLTNSLSMLQNTVLRLGGTVEMGAPIVLCNEKHRFLIAEQMEQIQVSPASIVLEPVGRNTAPAVAVAAFKALEGGSDPILLVLPADHHIERIGSFHEALNSAVELAAHNYLVTFGIIPDSPETGYGYIEKGAPIDANDSLLVATLISRFVEKPDHQTAVEYVQSDKYLWNSGMFAFRASGIIEEMERFSPAIVKAARDAVIKGKSDLGFFRLDTIAFQACPSDSLDYAVMERTKRGAVVPLEAGWSDLGSWDALWKSSARDEHGNACMGDILTEDVKGSYLHSASRLISAIGVQNLVVVETPGSILIAPRERSQDVKGLVNRLKVRNREEALNHRKNYRPWGAYESLNRGPRFQVKRLTIKPGAKLSLQKHHHRAEHWIVVHGTALVTRGQEQFLLKEDESTYIPLGMDHRLENPGKITLEIIEVQSGSYLGEDDIVRSEDIYNRTS